MATTTARRRKTHTTAHYWGLVKDMADSQKLELVTMLVNSVKTVDNEARRPRLYDPETGEYLNDETMKVIEDAHKGIGVTHYDSVDDMFRSVLGEEAFNEIRSSHV